MNQALNSTVYIKIFVDTSQNKVGDPEEYAYGTGMVILHDGYILTCNHVIEKAYKIQIKLLPFFYFL